MPPQQGSSTSAYAGDPRDPARKGPQRATLLLFRALLEYPSSGELTLTGSLTGSEQVLTREILPAETHLPVTLPTGPSPGLPLLGDSLL